MGLAANQIGIRVVVLGVAESARQMGRFQSDLNNVQRGIMAASQASMGLAARLQAIGTAFSAAGRSMTIGFTIPIGIATAGLLNAGIQFESAFAGIGKTIDGVMEIAADGTVAITDLGYAYRDMVREMALNTPIATNELARIGEIAGQLGVRGVENLENYIDVVAKLGVATTMSTDEAAFAVARLYNVMGGIEKLGMDIGEFANRYGAALVDLGNNAAATETEIQNLAMRIAGAGRVVGMSTPEVLGFAAALAEVGVRAELGGTAVSRVMSDMFYSLAEGVSAASEALMFADQDALGVFERNSNRMNRLQQDMFQVNIETQRVGGRTEELTNRYNELSEEYNRLSGQNEIMVEQYGEMGVVMANATTRLSSYAAVVGMTSEEFRQAFEEDAIGTIVLFIQSLADLQEAGGVTAEMMKELGLSGVRVRDVMNRLGGTTDLVERNVRRANEAWEEQIALNEEATKRFATVASHLQLLKNAFTELGIVLFDRVREPLLGLIDGFRSVIRTISQVPPEMMTFILSILAVVAAIGPALLIIGRLISLLGLLVAGFASLFSVAGLVTGALGVIGVALGGLALAMLTPQEAIDDLIDKIKQIAPNMGTAIENTINNIRAIIIPVDFSEVELLEKVRGVAGRVREALQNLFNPPAQPTTNYAASMGEYIWGEPDFPRTFTPEGPNFEERFGVFRAQISGWLDELVNIVKEEAPRITAAIADSIKEILRNAMNAAGDFYYELDEGYEFYSTLESISQSATNIGKGIDIFADAYGELADELDRIDPEYLDRLSRSYSAFGISMANLNAAELEAKTRIFVGFAEGFASITEDDSETMINILDLIPRILDAMNELADQRAWDIEMLNWENLGRFIGNIAEAIVKLNLKVLESFLIIVANFLEIFSRDTDAQNRMEKFVDMLRALSEIPGFAFIKDLMALADFIDSGLKRFTDPEGSMADVMAFFRGESGQSTGQRSGRQMIYDDVVRLQARLTELRENFPLLTTAFETGWTTMSGTTNVKVTEILLAVNTLFPGIVSTAVTTFETLFTIVTIVFDLIKTKITSVISDSKKTIIDFIKDVVGQFNTLKTLAGAAMDGLALSIGNVVGALGNLLGWLQQNVGAVVTHLLGIAAAGGKAEEVMTNSPTLNIQGAMEKFRDFLARTKFDMNVTGSIAPSATIGLQTVASNIMTTSNSTANNRNINITGVPIRDQSELYDDMMSAIRYMEMMRV